MEIPHKLAERGYTFVEPHGDGGKSITATLAKDDVKYLLKRPIKEELSKEEQFRFRQEAEALELLQGKGAPEVYDYDFDGDQPFIIMEFIKGNTLKNVVSGKPLDMVRALDLGFKILNIVGEIHEIGLLHRDIKPDNVIVSAQDKVSLIDFGLCRLNTEETFKTPAAIELGNRFLRLPELGKGQKIPSSVSDITFCIGLLFFMLSGKAPNQLLDEHGQPPHRRGLLSRELEDTKWLTYVFDKGFAYETSLRFQSALDMQEFIEQQRNVDLVGSEENPAEEFSKFIASADFQRKDSIHQMVLNAHRAFIAGASRMLNTDLATAGSGPNANEDGDTVVTDFVVHRNGSSSPISQYGITSNLSKDLSVISYSCSVNRNLTREGIHFASEKERIADEYSEMGKECGNMAIRNLIEMLKTF